MNNATQKEEKISLLNEALAKNQDKLYSLIRMMMVHRSQDVMDVLQTVNQTILQHAETYDSSKPVWPWMRTIAVHHVTDFFRNEKKTPITFDSDWVDRLGERMEEKSVTEELDRADYYSALDACMKKLSPAKRDLMMERYSSDGSIVSMAKRYSVSVSSLAMLFYRLRAKLRACIEKAVKRSRADAKETDEDAEEALAFERSLDLFLDQSFSPEEEREFMCQMLRSPQKLDEYILQGYLHAFIECRRRSLFCRNGGMAEKPIFRVTVRVAAVAAGLVALLAGGFFFTKRPLLRANPLPTVPKAVAVGQASEVALPQAVAVAAAPKAETATMHLPQKERIAPQKVVNAVSVESATGTRPEENFADVAQTKNKEAEMNAGKTAVVVTAVAAAMSASRAPGTSAPVQIDAAYRSAHWMTIHESVVPLSWNWPKGAGEARLLITDMNGTTKVDTSFGLETTNWTWQVFTGTMPKEENVYDLSISFLDNAKTVCGALTSRLAVVQGAFGAEKVMPETEKHWKFVDDAAIVPYDAAWTTNASGSAMFSIKKEKDGKTAVFSCGDSAGYFPWTLKKDKWGYGWFDLQLSFTGTAETFSAALNRYQKGTVVILR